MAQRFHCGEVSAKADVIKGGEAVGMYAGVGGDQEIRDEVHFSDAVASGDHGVVPPFSSCAP